MHERSSIGVIVVPIQKQYAGFLSRKIENAMFTKDLRIIDLSDGIGTTYETARRLVKGNVLPSRQLVIKLSKVLGLGIREMRTAIAKDRAHAISPCLFWLQQGRNPELEFLYLDWEYLNAETRQRLTDYTIHLAQKDAASRNTSSRCGTRDA
jgi:hypothetical protein